MGKHFLIVAAASHLAFSSKLAGARRFLLGAISFAPPLPIDKIIDLTARPISYPAYVNWRGEIELGIFDISPESLVPVEKGHPLGALASLYYIDTVPVAISNFVLMLKCTYGALTAPCSAVLFQGGEFFTGNNLNACWWVAELRQCH